MRSEQIRLRRYCRENRGRVLYCRTHLPPLRPGSQTCTTRNKDYRVISHELHRDVTEPPARGAFFVGMKNQWGQTTIVSCPLPICPPGLVILDAAARFLYPCGEVNYQEHNYHSVPVINRPIIQMSRNSSRQRLQRILDNGPEPYTVDTVSVSCSLHPARCSHS